MVRRGGRVGDQARAGERLHRGGRPRIPDVLADRQPDTRPARSRSAPACRPARSSDARRRRRSWEAGPSGRRRRRGRPQAPRRSCRWRRHAGESRPAPRFPRPPSAISSTALPAACEEVRLQPQVLGRVAGDRLLGEHDQLRARLPSPADPVGDQLRVALDVAHGGVHLGERDPQPDCVAGHPGRVCPRSRRST